MDAFDISNEFVRPLSLISLIILETLNEATIVCNTIITCTLKVLLLESHCIYTSLLRVYWNQIYISDWTFKREYSTFVLCLDLKVNVFDK